MTDKSQMQATQRARRKVMVGQVISNKMNKTVVILVGRLRKHPLYGRVIKRSKKLMAHDEKSECRIGDVVKVMETRPLSKRKRWRVVKIQERAQ